ncbi:MAG: hypothetical protein Q9222_006891 [Ikaeria aurantiellina]
MEGQLPPPPYSLHDPTPRPTDSIAGPDSHDFPSAASYFESRRPTQPRRSSTLPCHIAVLHNTTIDDLPMPKPERILHDRDVNAQDWLTFINHLIPPQSQKNGLGGAGEKMAEKMDGSHLHPAEPQRQQMIKAVVEEWNRGFFLPRGIEIVVRVEVTPRSPAASASSSSRSSNAPRHHQSISISQATQPSNEATTRAAVAANGNRQPKREKDADLGMALYRAVEKNEPKTVQVLLEAGADPDAKPSWATPSIVEAVRKGNLQILKMLLDHGPNIEAHGPGDGTALYTACSKGKTDMVNMLLKHKADPNFRPSGGDPALYKAVNKQYDEIVQLLLQQENIKVDDTPPGGCTAMCLAAKKGNIEFVKALLAAGANADARSMGSNTAMFEAAKKGNFEVCQILLGSGAQVDTKTTGGNTALWNIIGKKDITLIRLLLEHGANINAKAWGGQSVLERAVDKGEHGVVELLLQYKP